MSINNLTFSSKLTRNMVYDELSMRASGSTGIEQDFGPNMARGHLVPTEMLWLLCWSIWVDSAWPLTP